MSAHALYLVRMDVAHDHEKAFNDLYDTEHLPKLRAVPAVRRGSRYRQPSATDPRPRWKDRAGLRARLRPQGSDGATLA